jgi:hypothetical protein
VLLGLANGFIDVAFDLVDEFAHESILSVLRQEVAMSVARHQRLLIVKQLKIEQVPKYLG